MINLLKSLIPEDTLSQYFLIIAVVVVGALYIHDKWKCKQTLTSDNVTISYGYQDHNGPTVWKNRYASAGGSKQSPINLRDLCTTVRSSESCPRLNFSSDFNRTPSEMKIHNNGHTVIIYACWQGGRKPTLVGGPLTENYCFTNLRFRWGLNDYEGSEHMINSSTYAMELQAAFIRSDFESEDILEAARRESLLMLSYLFKITPDDNPYMEPIITCLKYIKCPSGCICIEPIILSLLMPEFCRDYYTYIGSLTFPPCTEGVRWIVKPKPLMISSKQVKKFRKLCGYNGLMEDNTRPVQNIANREIIYFN